MQYFYVIDKEEKLCGVLRIHDLLFPARGTKLSEIMIKPPLKVFHKSSLKELEEFFEEHHLFGVPVVDDEQRLIGIVLPSDVEEAVSKQKTKTL